MSSMQFTPVTPNEIYNGLEEQAGKKPTRLYDMIREHHISENNYMNMFANLVRKFGKRNAIDYAKLMGVNYRHFDGAIRCLSGLSVHNWIIEYTRLVACDLVVHTSLNFKEIGKLLGFSQSSFSQFFKHYEGMQPWEYRSLKKTGKKQGFFF